MYSMNTNQYTWKVAGTTVFGVDAINQIGELAKSLTTSNVALIITDKGVLDTGMIEKAKKPLEAAGFKVEVWHQAVPGEPTVESIEQAIEETRNVKPGVVIAFGGGSVLDSSKIIAQQLALGGKIMDYLPQVSWPKKGLPILAVPTTAGTGSETTAFAVLGAPGADSKVLVKAFFCDPKIVPDVALVDPMLTVGMPASLTAATGVDALTHVVGASYTKLANPYTRGMCLHAIENIVKYLPIAVAHPNNLEARVQMAYASYVGGASIQLAGAAEDHAFGHVLGSFFHCQHGVACAIALPSTMEYNVLLNTKELGDVAKAMGENITGLTAREAAFKAIYAVRTFLGDLGFPIAIKDLKGANKDDLPTIIEWMHASPWITPFYQVWTKRVMSKANAEKLVMRAWDGEIGTAY